MSHPNPDPNDRGSAYLRASAPVAGLGLIVAVTMAIAIGSGLLDWSWWLVLLPIAIGPGSYLAECVVVSIATKARNRRDDPDAAQ